MRKIVIIVNTEKIFFDSSIKEVIKKHGGAYVQAMNEGKSEDDTARGIRSILSDYTSNGEKPADVVISGFDYSPEILEVIEKNSCKLIWAC